MDCFRFNADRPQRKIHRNYTKICTVVFLSMAVSGICTVGAGTKQYLKQECPTGKKSSTRTGSGMLAISVQYAAGGGKC